MLVTKNGFDYSAAPYGKIAYIPAGIPVTPATNLPDNGTPRYWVGEWKGMDDKAASWHQSYGFLVDASEVAEAPFATGQRVRIKPCGRYPAIKSVRYGIIHGTTQHPGMNLIDKDRPSNAGEWAFCVASYASPNAGALWFSADGLEPMKREKKS